MKTKITPNVESERVTYPYFGITNEGSNDAFIVLFSKMSYGTVIASSENAPWNIGSSYSRWDEECFKPFKGTVEIS